MNVASVKTGKRGRPRFRHVDGVILSSGSGWDFQPLDPDLFGGDRIHLYVPVSFSSRRVFARISSILNSGNSVEVTLAFTGFSSSWGGKVFYDCRFVSFLSSRENA